MIIDIHGHYTTEPQALLTFRDKQLAGLADPTRRPASTDLGITDEMLRQERAAAAQVPEGARQRPHDLLAARRRHGAPRRHRGRPARSGRACRNDLIHRICTLLPDNFVGVGQLPQYPGVLAEELHPRARAHRRTSSASSASTSIPIRRAATGPIRRSPTGYWYPLYEKLVRARRAGDDPRHLVLQPEFPRHRRALHQRRHHRLHAADPGQPVQGFPDAEIRHPARRRRGAVPLGPLPRPRAGHEEAAARRAPAEERLLRHLRLPPARASSCWPRSSRSTTSCSPRR